MGNSHKRSFMPVIDVKSMPVIDVKSAKKSFSGRLRLGAPHGAYQILERLRARQSAPSSNQELGARGL
jgi:hypothetical protein